MLAISPVPVQFLDAWERGRGLREERGDERKNNAPRRTVAGVPELALVPALVPRSRLLLRERELVPGERVCS